MKIIVGSEELKQEILFITNWTEKQTETFVILWDNLDPKIKAHYVLTDLNNLVMLVTGEWREENV